MNTTLEQTADSLKTGADERIAWYQQKLERLDALIDSDSRRWKSMSLVRGSLFLGSVVLLILAGVSYAGLQTAWLWLAAAVFVAFLVIAFFHEGIETRRRKNLVWHRLYHRSQSRLTRDWDKLKEPAVTIEPRHASFVKDLDLFGKSSLFQLIGGIETPAGIRLIQSWILGVPRSEQILERQSAVKELQSLDSFRDQFRFLCHLLAASDGGPDTLAEWAEAPQAMDKSGAVNWGARILASLTGLALLGLVTGMIPITISGPFILVMLAANFLYTTIFAGRIHSIFNQVSTRHGEINHFNSLFEMIRQQKFSDKMLANLKSDLFSKHGDVLEATKRLGRIAVRANLRRDSLFFIVYILLQFGFLWDFHTLRSLQAWKRKYGSNVRQWFENLAHWEVLLAVAQFAKDHQNWTFPKILDSKIEAARIQGQSMGHPLLKNHERVDNDVQVQPSGSVLLVTGSNMSGKSTLLRSLGLNVVLAHLGGPVCAKSMELSPMRIETSMRIQDSLADGVSFFMAELQRLKQIVDIARKYEDNRETTVLFLLDEILQGTNSQERHIAVSKVIRHLIDHKAIGAVSTHDLELGKNPDLEKACQPIHFRESFDTINGKKQMTFDYKARQGIATTTNALKLLELVGLVGLVDEQDATGSTANTEN